MRELTKRNLKHTTGCGEPNARFPATMFLCIQDCAIYFLAYSVGDREVCFLNCLEK